MARKKQKQITRKKRINYGNIIAAMMFLLISIVAFNFGVMFDKHITNQMRQNCKMCSYFDKTCPYTDQELLDQEYGGGPCGDMGYYELKFKLGMTVTFGIGLMLLIMSFMLFKREFFSRRQTSKGKT